ncbi:hypothetical protein IFM89_025423 [Coptis chinensis]|uniref:Enolpyruvate transferase domain-containing protein n=1 Tax=Coptis chinensis TaxID=261450 RepID=A0A835I5D3_9MAGN|nr:hypothetical protein IFM89_025423 [Coptis chinensis]
MLGALKTLGLHLEVDSANNRAVVEGCGGQFPVGKESTEEVQLFLGNAGTAMCPLTAAIIAAGGNASSMSIYLTQCRIFFFPKSLSLMLGTPSPRVLVCYEL